MNNRFYSYPSPEQQKEFNRLKKAWTRYYEKTWIGGQLRMEDQIRKKARSGKMPPKIKNNE